MKKLVAVLAVCAAGSLLVAPASSGARALKAGAPVVPGSSYLALGDSVTFGFMESNVVPPPNYHVASNFPGYPEQVGATLHLKVANAACPGETSSSLINASAQSNGCENTVPGSMGGSYRPQFPLHVNYKGSQLAYALAYLRSHHNVRLVSLMIGANDYFVCVLTTKDGCTSKAEQQSLLSKISANVRQILSAIRSKAGYTGQVAIMTYYSLDYSSAAVSAMSAAHQHRCRVGGEAVPRRNRRRLRRAEGRGVPLRLFGSTCGAGLLTQLGKPGDCGVHPSYAGQALLAQALEKAIRL